MKKIKIEKTKLKGKVKISGSKNSSLAIICASLLTDKKVILKNVPNITDIKDLLKVFSKINIDFKYKNNKLVIYPNFKYQDLLFEEIKKIRASYYLMGVFLALFNKVKIKYPGGCVIGKRPIDFHLEGFKKAGCVIEEENGILNIYAKKLSPFTYEFPKKSLGGTVNLIILASKIEGKTILKNVSTEPEINDLIKMLKLMGINIDLKDDTVTINKNNNFKNIKYNIMPDRIEAFTYMVLGLYSHKLKITKINPNNLIKPIEILKDANAKFKLRKNKIIMYSSKLKPINVTSGNYPLLSTDQMPLLYPIFARVKGESIFKETIFENRFNVCDELIKSNANISHNENTIFIKGVNKILSNDYYPQDLRAAAALLIEAIIDGKSTVCNLHFLERGYENIYLKLKKIGVKFRIISD